MPFLAARRAFSLIELVIVVVIIGIIAAIAMPRLSRGATGAQEGALTGNLAVLRRAIDLFQAEHAGIFPDQTNVMTQLLGTTDASGNSGGPGGAFIYGPYLRSLPPLPVGARKGQKDIAAADGPTVGWIYDGAGNIAANCPDSEIDGTGRRFNQY
jgi:prepilin-type N-terminal cleavage/methylation domain-containing protein